MYELAAFMHIHNGCYHRVLIQPIELTRVFVVVFTINCLTSLVSILLFPLTALHPRHVEWAAQAVPGYLQYVYLVGMSFLFFFCLFIFLSGLFWRCCRRYIRDRKEILQRVKTFSLCQASCFEDDDLAFIHGQIRVWFNDVSTFDKYVRHDVAAFVKRLLRDQGPVPYHTVVLGSISHFLFNMSLALSAWQDGDMNMLGHACCAGFGATFCGVPIAVNLVLRLVDGGFAKDAPGGSLFCRRLLGPLVTATILAACNSASMGMLTPACPLWLCIAMCLLGFACACRLFNLRPWPPGSRLRPRRTASWRASIEPARYSRMY